MISNAKVSMYVNQMVNSQTIGVEWLMTPCYKVLEVIYVDIIDSSDYEDDQ